MVNTETGNRLGVIRFVQAMLKYGLLDSDAIAESLSKVGKCQDRNSEIPAGGPMAVQLLWLLGKGFAAGLNVKVVEMVTRGKEDGQW